MAQAFRSTRVVTPGGLAPATLVVEQEHITAVQAWNEVPAHADLHDYGNHVLLPGLVDSHVHINEPGRTEWEGFQTATRAAASGGVTTLVDMPLNCSPEVINVEALEQKRAAARGQAWVDWAAWGGVVRGNHQHLRPQAHAGVAGFKCFLIHSGIDGFPWVNEADLRIAMSELQSSGLPLLVHAEVPGPVDAATEALNRCNADWQKYATYLGSRPDESEVQAIQLLIRLAEEFRFPVHIVHLASSQVLPLLADARSRGIPVTVETCTQYLCFAAEDIPDGATEFKCAPPIRSAENREALWRALSSGLIDMVTTDHSPCLPVMKRREEGRWDRAWGGIASLGLALPVLWTGLVSRGLGDFAGLEHVACWMAAAPARLAGLTGRKGALEEGADADIAVFDPDAQWTVTESDLHFRHKLSPYLGFRLQGRVLETWLRGSRIFQRDPLSLAETTFSGEPRGSELLRI